MKKFLITGVPGVGKSTVGNKLKSLGYHVVDIDETKGLCRWINNTTGEVVQWSPGQNEEWYKNHKYICNKDKLKEILEGYKENVFVVGMPYNYEELWGMFDEVVLLRCKSEIFLDRLNNRVNHNFGQHKLEQENILSYYKSYEEDIIKRGGIAVNAEESVDEIIISITNLTK